MWRMSTSEKLWNVLTKMFGGENKGDWIDQEVGEVRRHNESFG
jgi:hypothetical protein